MTFFQSWLVLAGSLGFGIAYGYGCCYFTDQIIKRYVRAHAAMVAEETSRFNRLRLEWTARAGEAKTFSRVDSQ